MDAGGQGVRVQRVTGKHLHQGVALGAQQKGIGCRRARELLVDPIRSARPSMQVLYGGLTRGGLDDRAITIRNGVGYARTETNPPGCPKSVFVVTRTM